MPYVAERNLGHRKRSAEIGKDAVSQIISVLQIHSGGATLRDLVEELGVSRLTVLKRLHKMEADRLLYRVSSNRSSRGRPEIRYHLSDNPIQTVTNPDSTFFITEVGKADYRYNILDKTLDFRLINESIVGLDESILASSITDTLGNLKIASRNPALRGRFVEISDQELEKWAPWVAIVSALASQHDKLLGEAEYVAIERKEFNSLVLPFSRLGLIVNLVLEKTTEAASISRRVRELINHPAKALRPKSRRTLD